MIGGTVRVLGDIIGIVGIIFGLYIVIRIVLAKISI